MSIALYRTYRPARFADVIGQDHVTGPLSRALTNDRLHHAYLFSGPRGCGKTSSARIMARSMNCVDGPTPDPCGVCDSCVALAPNGPGSLDVIEMDAASHGGVDDARDLRDRAMFAPVSSRYKIYIIDEAHMVTSAGFNALLKLVEEPPPHVRFIFATTDPEKVIATIRSRTHHYPFRLVPARLLQDHLAAICAAEGVAAEPTALALVARAGQGSVRDALSVLGQLIGGSGPEGLTYDAAVEQLGFTTDALLDDVIAALTAADGAAMFGVVDQVVSSGHDPRRFVTDLLERWRDLLVLAAAPEAAAAGLVDAPPDRVAALREQADALGLASISRAADLTSVGLSELKGATAPRLQLELLAARLLLPAADDGTGGVLTRLDRLEQRVAAIADGVVPVASPVGGTHGGPPARAGSGVPQPSGTAAATPQEPAASPAPTEPSGPPRPPRPLSHVAPSTAKPTAAGPVPAAPTAPVPPAPAEMVAAVARAAVDDAAAGIDLGTVRTMWPAVLEQLKRDSRTAWTAFERSVPLGITAGSLAVGVPEQGALTFARRSGHDVRLREAMLAVLRVELTPDLVLDPGAATSGRPAAAEPSAAAAPGPSAGPEPVAEPEPTPRPAPPDPATVAAAKQAAQRARTRSGPGTPSEADQAVPPDDEPSTDDPDLDDAGLSGVALIERELGAVVVTEYDNS